MKYFLLMITVSLFSSTIANALPGEETPNVSVQKSALTETTKQSVSSTGNIENDKSALKLIDNLAENLYHDRMKRWAKERPANMLR